LGLDPPITNSCAVTHVNFSQSVDLPEWYGASARLAMTLPPDSARLAPERLPLPIAMDREPQQAFVRQQTAQHVLAFT